VQGARASNAADLDVCPVPPFAIAIDVPFQTPVAIVPTLVKLELTTVEFRVVPVRVPAADVTVIFPLPSKLVPLMVLAFCKTVAVAALPVVEPEVPDTFPVTFPVRAAVIVPAAKFPDASLATRVLMVLIEALAVEQDDVELERFPQVGCALVTAPVVAMPVKN
jgi:hypothetical protein